MIQVRRFIIIGINLCIELLFHIRGYFPCFVNTDLTFFFRRPQQKTETIDKYFRCHFLTAIQMQFCAPVAANGEVSQESLCIGSNGVDLALDQMAVFMVVCVLQGNLIIVFAVGFYHMERFLRQLLFERWRFKIFFSNLWQRMMTNVQITAAEQLWVWDGVEVVQGVFNMELSTPEHQHMCLFGSTE